MLHRRYENSDDDDDDDTDYHSNHAANTQRCAENLLATAKQLQEEAVCVHQLAIRAALTEVQKDVTWDELPREWDLPAIAKYEVLEELEVIHPDIGDGALEVKKIGWSYIVAVRVRGAVDEYKRVDPDLPDPPDEYGEKVSNEVRAYYERNVWESYEDIFKAGFSAHASTHIITGTGLKYDWGGYL